MKSGRESPYFFNLGEVAEGGAFATLGAAYAETILDANLEFDVLFGPAYKGIPIAVATAIALAERGKPVGVAFNRKEAKDHGEGGNLVGADVNARVLLVDDVLTSGKAVREALAILATTSASVVGTVIAMDRQEIADGASETAVKGLQQELGAPVISIANLRDLIEYLEADASQAGTLERMQAYQARYCVV